LPVQSAQSDIKQQVQPTSSKDHEDPVDVDDEISDGGFSSGTRFNQSYKLPPNTPMFMADWFFVFENAIE
jgi:hypothetical protein